MTIATALAGELPLALFFLGVARRILVRMVAALHRAQGGDGPPPRLRDARVLAHPVRPSAAAWDHWDPLGEDPDAGTAEDTSA